MDASREVIAAGWAGEWSAAWRKLILHQPRAMAAVESVVLTVFIGIFDYVTGQQISLSAFYLLPILIAAWFVGFRFGLFIAAMCVAVWVIGNVANGDDEFSTPFLICWNGGVQLVSDIVVVVAVTTIRNQQRTRETRAREIAAALTKEITERERLQRELLAVSEREQRRIGQDLHDGLCQHLAGTAMAGQVLREKLARNNLAETGDAQRIVDLIKEAILLSRRSAKGLYPVEFDAAGLMLALQEFADTIAKLFRVSCRFECESPVLVHDATVSEHMYRIVQEAVRNAIQHGGASQIIIRLETVEDGCELRVEDNGSGISGTPSFQEGMGLRIMAHRAQEIGGRFRIEPREGGGTVVTCALPVGMDLEDA